MHLIKVGVIRPLMLLQASNDLNLDLQRSILIGDRLTDLLLVQQQVF